ncbi:MAG TPA: diphosphomevalonate decarboxylase [Bacteroidota bacterium]|nr:diphosphomevalonate decarboxylase [Bacteroidota bacterium]
MNNQNEITAIAHPNIALAKYWGKRNISLNIPAMDSISITLDTLETITTLKLDKKLDKDEFILNNKKSSEEERLKISKFLDLFRNKSKIKSFAKVISENNFPTSAGLASSSSGFAALATAANQIYETNFNSKKLSIIARQGSGSAARSLFGGYVWMHSGKSEKGSDSFAEQIVDEHYFPLTVFILITSKQKKEISSRTGMQTSAETSPFYSAWLNSTKDDIESLHSAIINKDFETMAEISMESCIKMHSVMMTSKPPMFYWNRNTYAIIEFVRKLHFLKYPIFFTIDAGPQVKIITIPEESDKILKKIKDLNNILKLYVVNLGSGATILER